MCEQKTPGGDLNADLSEDFPGTDGDIDQNKFDTTNGGTEVPQEGGEAVFADAMAYMTTACSIPALLSDFLVVPARPA